MTTQKCHLGIGNNVAVAITPLGKVFVVISEILLQLEFSFFLFFLISSFFPSSVHCRKCYACFICFYA